jgi:replication factor C subunit 3/5
MLLASDNAPWVEKYRPKRLADIASHQHALDTIQRLAAGGRLPHLLLYGPPGTGKTTTVHALGRHIHGGAGGMTLELNASDDRGIEVVRDEITAFVSARSLFCDAGVKLVVLDECDAMTQDAQFALRRVMERHACNARFCLVANCVSKIIPAVRSRCTQFRFAPLEAACVQGRLEAVVACEGVRMGEGGMQALIAVASGDLRRAINVLQSCHMAFDQVDADAVYACTGLPRPQDVALVASWLLCEPFDVAFRNVLDLQASQGVALIDIVRQLYTNVMETQQLGPAVQVDRLVAALADVEHRLSSGTSERLQLGGLVGAFVLWRGDI